MNATLRALCLALAAVSCTEKPLRDPQADALLLKAAPTPSHPSDLTFENKVRLLGYDISTNTPSVGKPFKITWYWQVLEPLDRGYQLFTHLGDGQKSRVNLDADRVLRRVYPEAQWKKGDYLRDEQEIALPSDWDSHWAVFYLGFYADEKRLQIAHGKDDGTGRAEALRLQLTAAADSEPEPVTPALPRLIARKTTGAIQIDGQLNEPDWSAAQSTGPLVNTMTGEAGAFDARVQVLYDAEAFYAAFTVRDEFLKTPFTHDDEHLWEQDTVEIMFDPDGDARNYFELQVSPRGVHFDTRYDAPRNPRPFGHVDWSSQVIAQARTTGTIDDDQPDDGYVVELKVPWTAFATGTPPGTDSAWRINFFVMNALQNGMRAVGWSAPRIGDFHTLDKFGRVVFPEPVGLAQKP
ncbi:MAG: hypothetical protein RL701_6054 [Pseudomonadota bacterium]